MASVTPSCHQLVPVRTGATNSPSEVLWAAQSQNRISAMFEHGAMYSISWFQLIPLSSLCGKNLG